MTRIHKHWSGGSRAPRRRVKSGRKQQQAVNKRAGAAGLVARARFGAPGWGRVGALALDGANAGTNLAAAIIDTLLGIRTTWC